MLPCLNKIKKKHPLFLLVLSSLLATKGTDIPDHALNTYLMFAVVKPFICLFFADKEQYRLEMGYKAMDVASDYVPSSFGFHLKENLFSLLFEIIFLEIYLYFFFF